jgi:Putative polyhydroxyalkanoic acid system protein (PHA_gran_rgn)
MHIEYPLGKLTQDDAKARLMALGEYFTNKHGIAVTWSGDKAQVKGKYLVVSIEGSLSFDGTKAIFDGKDPGMLWRGKAKDYLTAKIAKYLDPQNSIDSLPRR